VASYTVNDAAVANARKLIAARQYVLDSDWGTAAPTADDENRFLKTHDWDDYAAVPINPAIRPVTPLSRRCEKNSSASR
jgi:hypothetical protein